MSIYDLKAKLADIPGVENLQMNYIAGEQSFSIAGRIITVPASANETDVEHAIRTALASPDIVTSIPMVSPIAEKPKGKPMAAQGGFAASIKAMMAEARAGVEKARSDGLSKVGEAVSKLNEAQASTLHVTSSMAKMIEDEAASVMSELGLISNDLNGEAQ